ncbi:MAG: HNH endonuclease [Nanoarchaeota archaeon]
MSRKLTDDHKQKLREAKLRNPTRYWLNKERKDMRGNTFGFKKNQPAWNSNKKMPQTSGEKHWNWKGGCGKRPLNSPEYKFWRKAVFEKDNYTCQSCGKYGQYLEAHHKKAWAKYPDLRYDINNGETLCKECHNNKREFFGNKYIKK